MIGSSQRKRRRRSKNGSTSTISCRRRLPTARRQRCATPRTAAWISSHPIWNGDNHNSCNATTNSGANGSTKQSLPYKRDMPPLPCEHCHSCFLFRWVDGVACCRWTMPCRALAWMLFDSVLHQRLEGCNSFLSKLLGSRWSLQENLKS